MPLFDVAAAEAAELARVGWCGWRFGRCGWFCMDRVLVTWTFEAEHRRDGSGRSAGRPPITKTGCGTASRIWAESSAINGNGSRPLPILKPVTDMRN